MKKENTVVKNVCGMFINKICFLQVEIQIHGRQKDP